MAQNQLYEKKRREQNNKGNFEIIDYNSKIWSNIFANCKEHSVRVLEPKHTKGQK